MDADGRERLVVERRGFICVDGKLSVKRCWIRAFEYWRNVDKGKPANKIEGRSALKAGR